MKAVLEAHHWRGTTACVLVLAALGFASRATFVQLPFLQEVVPARSLIAIGAAVLLGVPLYGAFAEFAPALAREPRTRALWLVVAGVVAVAAYAPAAVGVPDPFARADTVVFMLLASVSVLSVVLIGDRAWIVTLALGFTLTVVGSGPARPVTSVALHVPAFAVAGCVAAAVAAYLLRGPRRG